jgi:hypothetical protein
MEEKGTRRVGAPSPGLSRLEIVRVSCTYVQDPYDQIQIVDLSKDVTGHP